MSAKQCPVLYEREVGPRLVVRCTFIEDHAGDHSWWRLKHADVTEAGERGDPTPVSVKALLDAITEGQADPYLEAILSAAHSRKRRLRGTYMGFVRGERDGYC